MNTDELHVASHTSDELLQSFAANLRWRGRTSGTVEKYEQFLVRFVAWLDGRALSQVTVRQISDWLASWEEAFVQRYGRVPEANTRRNHHSALKAFFTYLELFDHCATNPVCKLEPPRVSRKRNDWLTPAEDDALLNAASSPQERIIVTLLRFTGMRVGEAVALRICDVDLHASTIVVRVSKSASGERRLPILPMLAPELRRWLAFIGRVGRAGDGRSPLLVTRNGTAMKPQYVWKVVKRVAHRAGVRRISASHDNLSEISPHTLRRTFGSWLNNEGLRLEVVSKLLGHASTAVTERSYVELTDHTIFREALNAVGRPRQ